MHVSVLLDEGPVKPTGLIVLAIGVVVTTLRAPDFVPHQNHRQPQRKHCHRQKVLHLPVSQLLDIGIIRGTLETRVPASVVIAAIPVVFAVWFVVFLVVRNKVIQCETVMTCHEVHALFGFTVLVTVDLWTAEQAVRKIPHGGIVTTKKTSDIIPEPP